MITLEKLNIYKKYKGDVDHYSRVNRNKHELIMESGDFSKIDSLLQDIEITGNGLTSESYLRNLDEKLTEICDSIATINELKRMAKTQQ